MPLNTSIHAEPFYPRAAAVATMQDIAGTLDRIYDMFEPVLHAGLPDRLRSVFESDLGDVQTGLSAYALADVHDARAQQLALATGDKKAAGEIILGRAENALIVGDYVSCEKFAQALMQLAIDSKNEDLRMQAEVFLGVLERRHGNLDSAISHQQRALDLAHALGDEAAISRTLAHLGTINRDRGDFARALDLQLQALVIGEKIDDRTELIYRNLALLYRELGDESASKLYFTKAIAAADRHGHAGRYAEVYGTYSRFLNDTQEYAAALDAARETLALDQVLNERPSIAYEQLESGRALLGLNRLEEAYVSLKEALAGGRALNQLEIVARSLVALAEDALSRGDHKQTRQLLQEASANPQASQSKLLLTQIYTLQERLASAEGDSSTALKYAHMQAALHEELTGTRANRRLSALESQYARAASEQEIALLTKDHQLQAARIDQQRQQRVLAWVIAAGLALLVALLALLFFGQRRLNRILVMSNAEIEAKRAALSAANQSLELQSEKLYQAAITDSLTGIFNRGHILSEIELRIAECKHDRKELAILLIDFDNFKQINDAHGHLFGDRVLITSVQSMRRRLPPDCLLGRFGGEEFIVAIAGRDSAIVLQIAEQLRVDVAAEIINIAPDLHQAATISIGVALLSRLPTQLSTEQLIDAADHAVYAAKANGRNQVMVYDGISGHIAARPA